MLRNKQDLFFVFSGGPAAGKTTLLEHLAKAGLQVIEEDARKIIREQVQVQGTALPWKDKALYFQMMLDASVKSYKAVYGTGSSEICLFDRGVLDAICYATLIDLRVTPKMDQVATACRYNSLVFLLPPWEEIYHTDTQRKQSWSEAVATYEVIKSVYRRYGYQVKEVPTGTLDDRRDFVMDVLNDLIGIR